ncbi:unnamed protein product [Didymodactylos carnosus]|uniref:Uncharacterized protein n=1 Tax=Didymodactylos carnosus TaxID=1234261 RepID=A0A814J063_9BILA|nr:unnamed protein product [Didymodactylos carnosus]CAF3801363.1 unnamed protein product [Didymodactylos carnosus]
MTGSKLSNINGLSLRKELATGDKLILSDELDSAFSKLGVFDPKEKAEESSLLCEPFDRIRNNTRRTGSTVDYIEDAKLSILGATTGMRYNLSDEKEATRPQHIKKRESVSSTASFAHIFAVCHLFGDIEYQFRDESDDESLILNSQEQTLNSQSNARYYTFNKTADLYEQRKKLTDQHSRNFHAKVPQLFPRYCTGFRIFKNVIRVLSAVEQYVIFEDRHNEFRQTDENFIIQAQLAIKRLFLDDKIERNEQKNAHSVHRIRYLFRIIVILRTHIQTCDRKYIREYHKYEDDPEMRSQIGILITDGKIRTTNVDGEIQYELDPDYNLINHPTKSLLPISAQAQLSSFVNIARSTTMIEDVLTSPLMNAATADKQPTEITTFVREAHLQSEDIELVKIVDDTCSNQAGTGPLLLNAHKLFLIYFSYDWFIKNKIWLIEMAFETIESAAAANDQERNNPNKTR